MAERRNAGWWAWLAGALFVALLIGALMLNRRTGDVPAETKPMTAPTPTPTASAAPELVKAEPPLNRSALIVAANAAASAFAVGEPPPAGQAALIGKRFTLRLPIGCHGPAPDGAEVATGWRYDAAEEALRVFAAPQMLRDVPWGRALFSSEELGAADIFWIERPWLLEGRCPARPASAAGPAMGRPQIPSDVESLVPAQQLGLVQLVPAGAPRSASRGGRAYSAVLKRAPETIRPESWFALELSGRLAAFNAGHAIACDGSGWIGPPRCLIAARIERAAIVDQNGSALAEWQQ